MKDYFKFNLKAEKLLPVWLTFMVLIVVPYVLLIVKAKDLIIPHQTSLLFGFYGILILIMTMAYAIVFYLIKLSIEGVEYKGQSFVFSGTFGQFMGKFLLGLFLSIITLGIYSPWFITNIHKFFIDNTSHDSNKLQFAGTGGKLFLILLLTIFLPMIVLMTILVSVQLKNGFTDPKQFSIYTNLFTAIVMTPYMYYVYKWMVNVRFRGYAIRWETSFWNSCGKILLEIFLSVITIGIYYPYAGLRLYKYFMERTVAVSESIKKGFGYELEAGPDFLFLWGQLLLTIITLGIYYPWAYCKISERILSKTYTEQLAE